MLTKVKFEIMNTTTDYVALNDTVRCGQNGKHYWFEHRRIFVHVPSLDLKLHLSWYLLSQI